MSKYAALAAYLHSQRSARVQMSFAEIEKVIGSKLPNSQRYPAWWSNNPMNNTMTQVWLDAGFQTEQVDIASRKLVFRRVTPTGANAETEGPAQALEHKNSGDHPLFVRLRGTATIPDGVDVTEPADPDWGALAYGDELTSQRG